MVAQHWGNHEFLANLLVPLDCRGVGPNAPVVVVEAVVGVDAAIERAHEVGDPEIPHLLNALIRAILTD